MYDYMRALHDRFCQEPELREVRRKLEMTYHTIQEKLVRQDQETLLQLADLENELREETSLASFVAGFQLGLGIAGELTPYCFDEDSQFSPAVSHCPGGFHATGKF